MKNNYGYHLLAIFTVVIWGSTYISTKILIENGLSPIEILFYRFLLAYFVIFLISPRISFADTIKEELLFAATGITGGSLYFILENTALTITSAPNVSLLICTAPILTSFLSFWIHKEGFPRSNFIYGSLLAFLGVTLVIFNNSFILEINLIGDLLTILATLSWAVYSLLIKNISRKYPIILITRKIFFYGIVTTIPIFYFSPIKFDYNVILQPTTIINILFLGIMAMLCYLMWNTASKHIGITKTANYIYITPLITLLTSSIFIDETITIMAGIGSLLILSGVYLSEKASNMNEPKQ